MSARPRVLVAIANHGTKNRHFLDRLLAEYRSMKKYELDLVVLSNVPKDLGDDIEVLLGMPSENPYSLPFAHKKLFSERSNDYDVFIYSEDDTLLREKHIDAFLEESQALPDDCIAGFMRYELDAQGRKYYTDMHSHFHWDIGSVVRHGNSVFAHYTNVHAACFILTRGQLARAIETGGFLLPPVKRRYNMRETAATDPYECCGMKKLICLSRFDDFCLHHLPNAYVENLDIDADMAGLMISKLLSFAAEGARKTIGPLFHVFPLRDNDPRNKPYHEHAREDVLQAIPSRVRSVLSVGCGNAVTEAELIRQGMEVTGIPMDPVIAIMAEANGVRILPPDFNLAAAQLKGRRFDCIMMLDILQQLNEPYGVVRQYLEFLGENGVLLVSVPNWNYCGNMRQRLTANDRIHHGGYAGSDQPGVHKVTVRRVTKWLRQAGLRRFRYCGKPQAKHAKLSKRTFGLVDTLLWRKIVVLARL